MQRHSSRSNVTSQATAIALPIPTTEPDVPLATHHVHHTDAVYHAVMTTIESREAAAKKAEDIRSIRRNRNRLAGLMGALFISLVLTWLFQHHLPTEYIAGILAPYAFVITITLDAGILAYAYIKRY